MAHVREIFSEGCEHVSFFHPRSIRNCDLFYCHPHLLRSLGVHSTVLGLMKTYFGISSGSAHNEVLSARRKQRLSMLKEGLPPPVEACCKFLCKFARISHSNQLALFDHIGFLLEHLEKYPGVLSSSTLALSPGHSQILFRSCFLHSCKIKSATSTLHCTHSAMTQPYPTFSCHCSKLCSNAPKGLMTCQGYTPLDVATATIKDNQELVLALEPSHLESVVSLLVATTTASHSESRERGGDVLLQVRTSSVSCEWSPNGGEKCLEFLQSAVWVDSKC